MDNKYTRNSTDTFNKKINKKNSISWSSENDDINDVINESEDKEDLFLKYEFDDLNINKNINNIYENHLSTSNYNIKENNLKINLNLDNNKNEQKKIIKAL